MKISFRKITEASCPELLFSWRLEIEVNRETAVSDIFIPELYFDYFFIQQGEIICLNDSAPEVGHLLPQQTFKPLQTAPLKFLFKPPLVLFGARFSLAFAELFWEKEMPANRLLPQTWLNHSVPDLATFSAQIGQAVQARRAKRTIAPMLAAPLEESRWLAAYSPRHKRRLYKSVYGLSRKEMQAINNIHQFLAQTCDFAAQTPRLVEHVNSELFYDQPHLNNAFKKMTGLSPLAYFEVNSILQDNLMAASYNEFID